MKNLFTTLIIILMSANISFAENQFYVGGGMGINSFNGSYHRIPLMQENIEIEGTNFIAKTFIGYQFFKYASIEAAFYRMGHAKAVEKDIDGTIYDEPFEKFNSYSGSFSLLGIIPITKDFRFFTRIGMLYTSFKHEDFKGELYEEFNDSGISVLVGGGLEIVISDHLALRAEVEWSPDIINYNAEAIQERIDALAPLFGDGFDVRANILMTTASVMWKL